MELIKKILKENAEVAGKMSRLQDFIKTKDYDRLSAKEQRLMIIQYNAMQVYADVLLQRIDEIKERERTSLSSPWAVREESTAP